MRDVILRIVEEIPPETRCSDFHRRVIAFLRQGVEEYWAVDCENEDIRIYSKQRKPALPDFKQTVAEFFAPGKSS
jgi:hypothetical protein